MLRVGVIGVGVMGAGHARFINQHVDGAEIVALFDIDSVRANELATELKTVKLITNEAEEVFKADFVDAVIIASPDHFHVAHQELAIKYKKPTLCEKPIATNIDDALAISKKIAAAEAGSTVKLISYGFMRRFDPGYMKVRERINSGEYGKPLFVRAVVRNVASTGITTSGLFSNIAIHDFDIYSWLFNSEWESIDSFYPVQTVNTPSITRDPLIFIAKLKNGIILMEDIVANNSYGYDTRVEVVCEKGNIEIGIHGDVAERRDFNFAQTAGGAMDQNWMKKFEQAYIDELRAWVTQIVTNVNNPDLASHEDAVKAQKASVLAINSAK
jgi:myo-inositol 2-dehydrogenase / D-chiro-inositol 1-dehydrogenase